ncbi:MarR family transcriptional regulator [Pontibacterium sp. N1Y112]|uniref:MarR family transcriptional regulator n=1 Tax=Pontibacterium sinense TaxID=2781979 RepID=A0A8J7FA14_9GAMM|nr:MarR family transcriptional regulator [Pontibacterium sinense]MBE9397720.1 MarR family transcriptional regulator [Pontibacterium sinense]
MGRRPPAQHLELPRFFPYKLSILQSTISDSIAQLYSGQFNLSQQEWRVIAALGTQPRMSAKEIAAYTSMDKMPVSRAISKLVKEELISQSPSSEDRRLIILNLTPKGLEIYEQIVPLVLEREEFLLSALSKDEQSQLDTLMEKLLKKAQELR